MVLVVVEADISSACIWLYWTKDIGFRAGKIYSTYYMPFYISYMSFFRKESWWNESFKLSGKERINSGSDLANEFWSCNNFLGQICFRNWLVFVFIFSYFIPDWNPESTPKLFQFSLPMGGRMSWWGVEGEEVGYIDAPAS